MSLIIEAPKSRAARITSGLRVSTETGNVAQLAHHRQDAPQLLVHGHWRGAGAARFAADIEDVRCRRRSAVGVRDGRFGVPRSGRRRRRNRA
jgi:hypothetical protein